jgi:hypothetical protein
MGLAFPKPARVRDPKFIEWSKFQGCALRYLGGCCAGLDFHHVLSRGGAGSDSVMGGSDYAGLAVCRIHHGMFHAGRVSVTFDRYEYLLRQLHRWLVNGEREAWLEVKHD